MDVDRCSGAQGVRARGETGTNAMCGREMMADGGRGLHHVTVEARQAKSCRVGAKCWQGYLEESRSKCRMTSEDFAGRKTRALDGRTEVLFLFF